MKGGENPSYSPNLAIGELLGLFKVAEVVLIDVGQLKLVVWDNQRLRDAALVVEVTGEADEGVGCVFEARARTERSEGVERKHIFPGNPSIDCEDEKLNEDRAAAYAGTTASMLLGRLYPVQIIQDRLHQHPDVPIGHLLPPEVIVASTVLGSLLCPIRIEDKLWC